MITRFLESFQGVKIGYIASLTGATVSLIAEAIPDSIAIERWLKVIVLFLTAVSLIYTIIQQAINLRSSRRK